MTKAKWIPNQRFVIFNTFTINFYPKLKDRVLYLKKKKILGDDNVSMYGEKIKCLEYFNTNA